MKENIFTINQRLQSGEINSKQAKAELLILFDVIPTYYCNNEHNFISRCKSMCELCKQLQD